MRKNSKRTTQTRKIVREEIRKATKKNLPIQYVDWDWTGQSISTTPTSINFISKIATEAISNNGYVDWPKIEVDGTVKYYRDFHILGVNCQFRTENALADHIDSLRMLMFRAKADSASGSANYQIMDGTDIDSPPNTERVQTIYKDKPYTVYNKYDGTGIVGVHYIKFKRKVSMKFRLWYNSGASSWEVEDAYMGIEFQSDSSAAPHPLVYGYTRIYYKELE